MSTALVNSQLVCLRPVGILNPVMSSISAVNTARVNDYKFNLITFYIMYSFILFVHRPMKGTLELTVKDSGFKHQRKVLLQSPDSL